MKKLIILLSVSICSCTSDYAFKKGKEQLEQQGYTDVRDMGYTMFCCDEKDQFSTGFKCKNTKGEKVEGCFCSGITKGVTIRFE